MGANHTVEALADWRIPLGAEASSGHYIRERTTQTNAADCPGDWARLVNNLYEWCKPPLVDDSWQAARNVASGAGPTVLGRYRIPHELLGSGLTGADIERLRLTARVRANGGGTGEQRIQVTESGLFVVQSFVNAAYDWVQAASGVGFDDELGDAPDVDPGVDREVTVQLDCSGGGSADMAAAQIWWEDGGSPLADGPYSNEFAPCQIPNYETRRRPLSVAMMRRLLGNLDGLRRRRIPGMICATYLQANALSKTGGGTSNQYIRALGFRPAGVDEARVYVYADATTPPDSLIVELRGATTAGVSETISGIGGSLAWHRADLVLEPHHDADPVIEELVVKTAGSESVRVRGCCAWYRAMAGEG